jgi:hypothetical protein
MKCSDETKKEILARVVGFTKKQEALGLDAQQLQEKITAYVLLLNQNYDPKCVREVLRALNDNITGPLN